MTNTGATAERMQYRLWPADTGFDAWDVDLLISPSRELPVHVVGVNSVREVGTVYRFDGSTGAGDGRDAPDRPRPA